MIDYIDSVDSVEFSEWKVPRGREIVPRIRINFPETFLWTIDESGLVR